MKGNLLDCFKLQYYARRLTSTDPTMIFGPHFNPNMGLKASWYSAHWAAAHMYFANNWLPRLQSFYAGGQRTFKTQYHVMFVRLVMEAKDLLVWLATQGQKLARGFLQRRRLLQLKDDFTKYQLSVMRELVAAFKPTGTEASKSLLPIELLAIFLNENPAKVAMGPYKREDIDKWNWRQAKAWNDGFPDPYELHYHTKSRRREDLLNDAYQPTEADLAHYKHQRIMRERCRIPFEGHTL